MLNPELKRNPTRQENHMVNLAKSAVTTGIIFCGLEIAHNVTTGHFPTMPADLIYGGTALAADRFSAFCRDITRRQQ